MTKRSVLFGITVIAVVLFACSCKDPAGVDKNKPFLIQRDENNAATLTIKTFDKQAKTGTFEFVQSAAPNETFTTGTFEITTSGSQQNFKVTESSNLLYVQKMEYPITMETITLSGVHEFKITELLK